MAFLHRVHFTSGVFDCANPSLRGVLAADGGERARAIVFVDSGVVAAWPDLGERISAYFAQEGMPQLVLVTTVQGGESCKNSWETAQGVIDAVNRHGIDRKSFVIGLGGGAVLDAVGFGAAVSHRGVRMVRIPTTVLAQDDAAMGVKNGINAFGKKNFIGTFAPPWAVLCDSDFLSSLTDAQFHSGFSEVVKISLLRDPDLFLALEREGPRIAQREMNIALPAIERSARLHLNHIVGSGDAFETRDTRPLDFGHWAAHRLEEMSSNALPHGDAVAVGIALDCAISSLMGWLPQRDLERILAVLRGLRLPTSHPLLEHGDELLRGLEEFREHLGGQLCVTLLRGIGHPEDVHSLDADVVRSAVRLV